jgi:FtsH-binding integral membrane protein
MTNIPKLFFLTGALLVLGGMLWGIQMSATQDHTLAPAHAHLNLIGFVVMTIYGIYYALTPHAAAARLATIHFLLTVAAVVIMVPGIVMAISGTGETLAKIGSVLAVLSMALFAFTIARKGVGISEIDSATPAGQRIQPAE